MSGTRSAEEFDEARMTVRLLVLLLKRSFIELLQAERADEVFRVELFVHGGDTAACDWLVTAGAEGAAACVVVGLTVRHAFVVEKTGGAKWHTAFLQGKNVSYFSDVNLCLLHKWMVAGGLDVIFYCYFI